MLLKKLLSRNVPAQCGHCVHGKLACDGENVLCIKMGIMLPDSSCGKYKYDPLKRQPKKPAKLPEYAAEEFKL